MIDFMNFEKGEFFLTLDELELNFKKSFFEIIKFEKSIKTNLSLILINGSL